jgi:hypothetical protein
MPLAWFLQSDRKNLEEGVKRTRIKTSAPHYQKPNTEVGRKKKTKKE